MRVAWATDLHLEQASAAAREAFAAEVQGAVGSGVRRLVVTGDISTASRVCEDLVWLRSAAGPAEVYFVLGNHDFFGPHGGPDFVGVRDAVVGTCASASRLTYLHEDDRPIELEPGVLLVGVDGWFDGRLGRVRPVETLPVLADRDTRLLLFKLEGALRQRPRRVVIATHVPPFAGASWYNGRPATGPSACNFCNVGMGRELLALARAHAEVSFVVLAGHTHSAATYKAARNLVVRVLAVEEGRPSVVVEEV